MRLIYKILCTLGFVLVVLPLADNQAQAQASGFCNQVCQSAIKRMHPVQIPPRISGKGCNYLHCNPNYDNTKPEHSVTNSRCKPGTYLTIVHGMLLSDKHEACTREGPGYHKKPECTNPDFAKKLTCPPPGNSAAKSDIALGVAQIVVKETHKAVVSELDKTRTNLNDAIEAVNTLCSMNKFVSGLPGYHEKSFHEIELTLNTAPQFSKGAKMLSGKPDPLKNVKLVEAQIKADRERLLTAERQIQTAQEVCAEAKDTAARLQIGFFELLASRNQVSSPFKKPVYDLAWSKARQKWAVWEKERAKKIRKVSAKILSKQELDWQKKFEKEKAKLATQYASVTKKLITDTVRNNKFRRGKSKASSDSRKKVRPISPNRPTRRGKRGRSYKGKTTTK